MENRCLGLTVISFCFVLHFSGAAQSQLTLLSDATFDFSQRLYQQIAINKTNVVYSPYSIHSALTMTSDGAKGDTLTEMRDVLGLSALGDYASSTYHDLIVQLNNATKVKLHTANGVFVNPQRDIEATFLDDVNAHYFAMATKFNLQAQEGPEKDINDFVAQKTEHMIENILGPGSIDGSTLMVLINTIFFNGTWQEPFAEYKTRKQDFHQLGGEKTQVNMMKDERWLRYKRDTVRNADILELPFKGGRFSLNILLPHEKDGVTSVETTLSDGVGDLFQNLTSTNIAVSFPKFKINTKLSLSSTLMAMGMRKAFNPSDADFSGISTQGTFYMDQVIHQAVMEVKETGTVAAAATVVGIRTLSVHFNPPPSISFIADHPFLFFLRDSKTGQVLFQGKFSG